MAGAGVRIGDQFAPKKPKAMPTEQFGNPNSYTAAANTQAKDYDRLMGMYSDFYGRMGGGGGAGGGPGGGIGGSSGSSSFNPINFSPIAPQTSQYRSSPHVDKSLNDLSELSTTGGYSEQGIADLRSRGISPIRSVYANAQRNLDRSKSLSGGYSPNYAAATAKMAREQGDLLSQRTTDVNAGIAQNVASNRLTAAPAYSSNAQRENEARTAHESHNADIVNMINQMNAEMGMKANMFNSGGDTQNQQFNIQSRNAAGAGARGDALGALEGMRNLYGTTPALTHTFGNQVGQASNINQNQQQIEDAKRKASMSILPRARNG